MIKQTKNIYYCKESEVPSKMTSGSMVFTIDEFNTYLYPNGSKVHFVKDLKKELKISISQKKSFNPTIDYLFKNTSGSNFKIKRNGEGDYSIKFKDDVIFSNCSIFNSSLKDPFYTITANVLNSKEISIKTFDEFNQLSDSVLNKTSFIFSIDENGNKQ